MNDPILAIENFKSFKEKTTITFKPITIIVGPNGSGKTTIIDAIQLFSSAIGSTLYNNETDRNDLKSRTFYDCVSSYSKSNKFNIGLTFGYPYEIEKESRIEHIEGSNQTVKHLLRKMIDLFPDVQVTFKNRKDELVVSDIQFNLKEIDLEINIDLLNKIEFDSYSSVNLLKDEIQSYNVSDEWNDYLSNTLKNSNSHFLRALIIKEKFKNYLYKITMRFPKAGMNRTEKRLLELLLGLSFGSQESIYDHKMYDDYYIVIIRQMIDEDLNPMEKLELSEFKEIISLFEQLFDLFKNIFSYLANNYSIQSHIDEIRNIPPSLFEYKSGQFINDYYGLCKFLEDKKTIDNETYPVRFENKTIFRSDDKEYPNRFSLNTFIKLLSDFGIADNIKLKEKSSVNQNHKFYVVNLNWEKQNFNLSQLSSGGKQLLPILLSLVKSDPDGISILRQPELHLHPKLAMKLADLFVERWIPDDERWNKIKIIETHSEHMIRKFQILIANGELRKDEIQILYVNPIEDNNGSEIISIGVNERGMFTNPWPNGFFEESAVLNIQLIEAITSRKN